MLELRQGLVSAVKYKYNYKNLEREPCVGATPRACQCCLLKAIDCDSRLSNYQLISQLSATIMMTIMMALLAMLLMIDNEIVIGVVLNFQPQLILGAV